MVILCSENVIIVSVNLLFAVISTGGLELEACKALSVASKFEAVEYVVTAFTVPMMYEYSFFANTVAK